MPHRTKVDGLPPKLKAELERLLVDRNHAGYRALSAWLAERGYTISYGGIRRHDARLQAMMSRIRERVETARLLAQMPGDDDDLSSSVIRMVQSELLDALMRASESESDPAERVKMLAQAARAIAEAIRAGTERKRWQDEVRAGGGGEVQHVRAGMTMDEIIEMIRGAYGV